MNHYLLLLTMQAVWLRPITWTRVVQTCGQTGKSCAHWEICSQKDIGKESKNCRTRLHSARWKTLRVEPSESAASFGEGGGRLQRTDSDTVLKSSELQENTRPCRPVLLFSSFTPGDLTASLQSSFCALSPLSSHWTTSLIEVTVLRFFFSLLSRSGI